MSGGGAVPRAAEVRFHERRRCGSTSGGGAVPRAARVRFKPRATAVFGAGYTNGRKFHITRDQMLEYKRMSNGICHKYGLSMTEPKTRKKPRWKDELIYTIYDALRNSATKEEFIEFMQYHGYEVKWDKDRYKYITFTTPEGMKVRDNKLFDECLLKDNLELYFLMGGSMESLPVIIWTMKHPNIPIG